MSSVKQVSKEHYSFSSYMEKPRWNSVWHQLDEVLSVNPESVLEVGPGPGLFKAAAKSYGIDVKTLDIAGDLNPDILASATKMPLGDGSVDTICCFQMLEHLPLDMTMEALQEFNRVANKNIIISLPDAKTVWLYSFRISKFGKLAFYLNKPFQRPRKHIFDGEHYWEINKLGYELAGIIDKFDKKLEKFSLIKTYRVAENPYHRFFIYKAKE